MEKAAFQAVQREIYERTLAETPDRSAFRHSIHYFLDQFQERPAWCIGPMEQDGAYTFRKPAQWKDPTQTGWRSGFLFNPSLIEKDGKLFLFYRAAPKIETLCSRIGLAVYTEGAGWQDYEENPVVYPGEEDEVYGVEDPKIYKLDNRYVMFYNGVSPLTEEMRKDLEEEGLEVPSLVCDVKAMVSEDLYHWERTGLVVPREVSRYWAKGAVIPRNPKGEAVKLGGEYLMYLSEGCGGKQVVGRSADGFSWCFEEQPYLDLGALGTICEVACAVTDYGDDPEAMVLDVFYTRPDGTRAGLQALYSTREPFRPLALNQGATLSWGGLIQYRGKWMFSQGWDAKHGAEELYFYTAPVK